MSDNTQYTGLNANPKPVQKTDSEILKADLHTLSNEELTRRKLLTDIMAADAEREDTIERLQDRKGKREMKYQEYKTRGQTIDKTQRDYAAVQASCKHKKGGRGNVPGGFLRGTDVNYSIIRHTLPTNELYIRCTRCGKTWKPANPLNFDLKTEAGQKAFAAAKQEYSAALEMGTDNVDSGSVTFSHTSPDNNVTAVKFVQEVMKDVNLR